MPVLEPLFYKIVSLQACNVIKKKLLHGCFPVKFDEFLRAPILKNIYERYPMNDCFCVQITSS